IRGSEPPAPGTECVPVSWVPPSRVTPKNCHPERSGPIFSFAPICGASGRVAEGSASLFLCALCVTIPLRLRPDTTILFSLFLGLPWVSHPHFLRVTPYGFLFLRELCVLCDLCVTPLLSFCHPDNPSTCNPHCATPGLLSYTPPLTHLTSDRRLPHDARLE